MREGLTLIELMITIAMLVILIAVVCYVLIAVLLSWSSQEKRAGIDISIDRGIEEVVRDLRGAREIQSASNEIRFTRDGTNYYVYYLYNAGNPYYELRKTTLTGGIGGSYTSGSGNIKITDVLSPPTSSLSVSGYLVTMDLSVKRGDETIRSRTSVGPRNL